MADEKPLEDLGKPAHMGNLIDKNGNILSPNLGRNNPSLPVGIQAPTPRELGEMDRDELAAVYFRYVRDPRKIANRWMGATSRLAAVPAGTPNFEERFEDDLVSGSKIRLLEATRSVTRTYSIMQATQNKPEQIFIRVTDGTVTKSGGTTICAECEARAGAIGTMEFHDSIGAPGVDS